MVWVRVPPENEPLFRAALPDDERVETARMFGGIVAKVNGHVFAGLFGRSTMVRLDEQARSEALALEGSAFFDPMGDGRGRSQKIMLPVAVMHDATSLRDWIARAFEAATRLPKKEVTKKKRTKSATKGADEGRGKRNRS
jgi:TfoX/Sxy family transcriptional regulator of competence genes